VRQVGTQIAFDGVPGTVSLDDPFFRPLEGGLLPIKAAKEIARQWPKFLSPFFGSYSHSESGALMTFIFGSDLLWQFVPIYRIDFFSIFCLNRCPKGVERRN